MSPDELPVLPTVDKRASRKPSKALEPTEADRMRMLEKTIGAEHLRNLSDVLKRKLTERQEVVTVHTRYGQPPGDLAYVEAHNWNAEQQERAAAWIANEQAKDWWQAQAAAQKAAAAA